MEKRKLISLTLALAMSTGLLSGCNKQTQAYVSGDPETVVVTDREKYLAENQEETLKNNDINKIDSFETSPGSKEFEAGQHVFMIRYDLLEELGYEIANNINSLSITIPEGYEILSMENFTGLGTNIGTGQTYGVDIWFINNKKVLVEPFYNEKFEHYDYSRPGKVIELEEKEDMSLTK